MNDVCGDLSAHGLAAWNVEYRRVGAGGGWPRPSSTSQRASIGSQAWHTARDWLVDYVSAARS